MIKINDKKPVNAFRPKALTPEEASDLYCNFIGVVKCTMGVINSCAYYHMMNAIDKIKRTPLYRHEVKRIFNICIDDYNRHERNLLHGNRFFRAQDMTDTTRNVTDQDLFDWYLDIGACAYKRTEKQVEMLRWQILQSLTRLQCPHREALSYVCVASALLEYAARAFRTLMADFTETTKKFSFQEQQFDISGTFADFSLAPVYRDFRRVAVMLCNDPQQLLTKEEQKQTTAAFRAFEKAMMADITYATSACEATEANKELLDPDVYEEFKENYKEALEKVKK